jgi:hypothetical protein
MPRKKKSQKLEFIDGKVDENIENQAKAKTIEEILQTTKNPFGTNSMDELEKRLEGMNLVQMQELAVQASVFPSGNKTTLRNKIKKEFKAKYGTTSGHRRYTSSSEAPLIQDAKIAEKVMRILNER